MTATVATLTIPDKPEQDGMQTVTMTVTPGQAKAWLDAMPIQRRLRAAQVEKIARAIRQGRWKLTANGIAFDRAGVVMDGQHRLSAIIAADRPVSIRVTFGVERSAFLATDSSSSPKTVDDALRHDGVPAGLSTIAAQMVRMLYRTDRGFSAFQNVLQPDNEEAITSFYEHDGIMDAARLAQRVKGIVPSLGVFGFYILQASKIDTTKAVRFAEQVGSGINLQAGSPALLLRNTFMEDRMKRVRRDSPDQAIMIATAINAHLRGKSLRSWAKTEFGKGKIPVIAP